MIRYSLTLATTKKRNVIKQRKLSILKFLFLLFIIPLFSPDNTAQINLEVEGNTKLSDTPTNSTVQQSIMKQDDGTLAKRDVSSFGVTLSGIIMNDIENNPILLFNGFTYLGKLTTQNAE